MELQLDLEDALGIVVYPFASLLALGIMSPNFNLAGVPDLPIILASGTGWEITLMGLVAVAAVGYVFATNWYLDGGGSNDYEAYEWALVIVAVAVVPAYMLIPAVADLLNSSGWLSLGIVVVQSTGVVLLSYYG